MFKVNEYFDGKVKSIAFNTSTLPATVGVMAPGAYTFNTAEKEAVTIVSGAMDIQLPGSEDWNHYAAGDTFKVPANSAFNLKISEDTAYLCLYG
ncbi:MAG: pyrimidine/purine nucleoside phosphorylase [Gammaproteobacteria bacterium]